MHIFLFNEINNLISEKVPLQNVNMRNCLGSKYIGIPTNSISSWSPSSRETVFLAEQTLNKEKPPYTAQELEEQQIQKEDHENDDDDDDDNDDDDYDDNKNNKSNNCHKVLMIGTSHFQLRNSSFMDRLKLYGVLKQVHTWVHQCNT
jgi:hypothetical protein